MNIHERQRFIEEYIKKHGQVDILNTPFVDAYIKFTGAKHVITMWGAHKCPRLSRDLGFMYRCNLLDRSRVKIDDARGQGFPSSVLLYTIKRF